MTDSRVEPPEEPRLVKGEYTAPRSELEAVLTRLWSEVLGMGRVGVTDDFFELGGNSVVAIRLVASIRDQLGVTLAMRELFDHPTVAEVAARIEQLRTGRPAAEDPIPRIPR